MKSKNDKCFVVFLLLMEKKTKYWFHSGCSNNWRSSQEMMYCWSASPVPSRRACLSSLSHWPEPSCKLLIPRLFWSTASGVMFVWAGKMWFPSTTTEMFMNCESAKRFHRTLSLSMSVISQLTLNRWKAVRKSCHQSATSTRSSQVRQTRQPISSKPSRVPVRAQEAQKWTHKDKPTMKAKLMRFGQIDSHLWDLSELPTITISWALSSSRGTKVIWWRLNRIRNRKKKRTMNGVMSGLADQSPEVRHNHSEVSPSQTLSNISDSKRRKTNWNCGTDANNWYNKKWSTKQWVQEVMTIDR